MGDFFESQKVYSNFFKEAAEALGNSIVRRARGEAKLGKRMWTDNYDCDLPFTAKSYSLSGMTTDVSPEKNLLAAIVYRAVCDLFSKMKQDVISAERFFECRDRETPFTCGWICEELQIEYPILIKGVDALVKKHKKNRKENKNYKAIAFMRKPARR